jgi:hypothetical protein
MTRLLSIATVAMIAISTLSLGAQQAANSTAARAAARSPVPRVALAQARKDSLASIQGNALDSANRQLNNVMVRLRDARFGHIVDTQLTDKSGLFAFKSLEPGSYIVELMSNDQTILAASQLLSVNAGEVVSAVVKLPFRISPFSGLVGSTTMAAAAAVTAAAAASGIATVVKTNPISPAQ